MDLIIRPVSCLVLYVIKKVDYSYGFHLYSVTTPGTFQNMMCSCNCMKKPNILTTLFRNMVLVFVVMFSYFTKCNGRYVSSFIWGGGGLDASFTLDIQSENTFVLHGAYK